MLFDSRSFRLSVCVLLALTLAVGLGGIVTLVNDEIGFVVVLTTTEVAVEDGLCALCVSLLCIQAGTRHVSNHTVATAHGVLGVSERVVLWCWLREPDITTVAVELARLEGLGDVLLDDDGATGSVDEVSTYDWLVMKTR